MKKRMWKNKGIAILFFLALISLNIWLISKITFVFEPLGIIIKTVMIPVVLAGVFYYLFHPIVDWAEKRKVKRGVSILLLYVSVIWALSMALSFVIPTLIRQIKELVGLIPTWWEAFKTYLENWDGPHWADSLINKIQVMIDNLPVYATEYGSGLLMELGSQIFPIVGTITGLITVLVITPFVLFYLLKDGKKLPLYILKFFPVRTRNKTHLILKEMNQQISQYIRGQILVSLCIGFLLYIGYLIIGLPYALTLAIVAALTSVVPYVGPTIAISPAIILALFTSPIMLVKLVVVWTAVQLIEGKVITPQVMGRSIHVHPITIIFVILCAGKLFGALGLVLAIPTYAVLKVVATHTFEWVKNVTNLYKEESNQVTEGETGS